MYKSREKVFWFSVISRATVILLQFVFNSLCPDHEADAFRSPRSSSERISISDKFVDYLLGGLTRWDSQYFIHIAKYGYTYENTLVFFPLYPTTVRLTAFALKHFLFFLNEHSVVTVSAVLVNATCFVASAMILYDLSERVLGSSNLAYKAAVLYCINPASIFFSAVYSESMFACLTFYSMLTAFDDGKYVCLPVGLSSLVRSNGLINVGFPIFATLKNFVVVELPTIVRDYDDRGSKKAIAIGITRVLIVTTKIFRAIILSLIPFFVFQIYIYVNFCTNYHREIVVPEHVVNFSKSNDFPMPGDPNLIWCTESLPMIYSKIQKKYWNVGFMNYYEIKQIPNFVLAFPILFIMTKCILQYFYVNKKIILNFSIIRDDGATKNSSHAHLSAHVFVFVVHGLFLTFFCIFFVHIQVSTRLLASASPLPYWYCASLMSHRNKKNKDSKELYDDENNVVSRWKVFFMFQKIYTTPDILVLMYFLGYFILGIFMYSNFLPWT